MPEEFDKTEFASLLKTAMAGKTPFEYCRKLHMNGEYIDRILQAKQKKPPSMGVIEKIARESKGLVTLEQLSIAAGYAKSSLPSSISFTNETERPQAPVVPKNLPHEMENFLTTQKHEEEKWAAAHPMLHSIMEGEEQKKQDSISHVPKDTIHIPEEFLKQEPKPVDAAPKVVDARTPVEKPQKKAKKKEKRRRNNDETTAISDTAPVMDSIPPLKNENVPAETKVAPCMPEKESMPAPASISAPTSITNRASAAMTYAIPGSRDIAELNMYRSMSDQYFWRIYKQVPSELNNDIFCFGNETGVMELFDFSLYTRKQFSFNDLCMLYGRYTVFCRQNILNYRIYTQKGKEKMLRSAIEQYFGPCDRICICEC